MAPPPEVTPPDPAGCDPVDPTGAPEFSTAQRERFLEFARSRVGVSYVWGAHGPVGWDGWDGFDDPGCRAGTFARDPRPAPPPTTWVTVRRLLVWCWDRVMTRLRRSD